MRLSIRVLLLICFVPVLALAQSDSSSLSGVVADASGAVVPNATVTITNTATKLISTAKANENGVYTVPNLSSGDYDVRFEAAGFQQLDVRGVHVDPVIGRKVNGSLKVGEATATVTVQAEVNTVQTESAASGQLITEQQVKSVQLNGRNPFYLALMQPGVVRFAPMASINFGLDSSMNIGGSRSVELIVTLDGAPMVRTRNNDTSVGVADVDSTSQVQILTNAYPAEYGRTNGGQVRIIPKSGTSQFHGTAYEYLRNTFFNANQWGRKLPSNSLRVRSRPPGFTYNQFGFNLNGPVTFRGFNQARNKLFFLFGQEYVRYRYEDTIFQKVPTALMRQGNFSELLGPNIFYGSPQTIYKPSTRVAYAGNIIPTSDLSANGLGLLNEYPAANAAGSNYNYLDSAANRNDQRKDTVVLDYIPSEGHRLRFTLLNYSFSSYEPHFGNFNLVPRVFDRPNHVGVLHYTWTINPKTLNEFIAGATIDQVNTTIDTSSGRYDRTKYGINYPYLFTGGEKLLANKVPTVQIANFTTNDIGPYPSRSAGMVYNFADNLTRVFGQHTVKAGVNYERSGENNFDQIVLQSANGSTNNQNGAFVFSDSRSLPSTTSVGTSGVAIANAALGLFDTYGEIGQKSYTLYRSNMFEGFVQDHWRATTKLLLEAGVRYSWYPPYYALWGNQAEFNPAVYDRNNAVTVNPTTDVVTGSLQSRYNGVVIPGSGFPSSAQGHVNSGVLSGYNFLFRGSDRGYSPTIRTDIQPRAGFSYEPRPGTVIRGGGGRYVQRLGISGQVFTGGNAPFQPSASVGVGSVDAPSGGSSNIFPLAFTTQAHTYPSPYTYNWNLTIEQELQNVGVLTVGYGARRGVHLEGLLNINQLLPGTVQANPTVTQKDALRPYQGFSTIRQATNYGANKYHSLQVNLRRRMTKGLLFGVAYTWSKSLDYGSSNGAILPNTYDKSGYYGASDFDRRHTFLTNFVYEWNRFDNGGNRVTRTVLGRWQVSGTVQTQTGQPLSVTTGTDFAGVGPGSAAQLVPTTTRPNLYKNFAGQTGTGLWFDTSVFPTLNGSKSSNALTTLFPGQLAGRGTRNQIYGAGFQSWNLAMNKSIRLIAGHDNHLLTFRAEAFNFLNHPTPDNPDTNYTSGTFGRSTTKGGTYDEARQFQFSLRYSF
jgi:hypothetical protein